MFQYLIDGWMFDDLDGMVRCCSLSLLNLKFEDNAQSDSLCFPSIVICKQDVALSDAFFNIYCYNNQPHLLPNAFVTLVIIIVLGQCIED